MSRIIIEEFCEHGFAGAHTGYSGGFLQECDVGKRTVLTAPTDEMVERAAEASFNAVYPDGVWKRSGRHEQRGSFRRSARAALAAALFEEE